MTRGWRIASASVLVTVVAGAAVAAYGWRRLGARVHLATPAPTRLFLDRGGRFLAEVSPKDDRLGDWKLEGPIPRRVEAATLAAEDARFFEDAGVDPRAILRAGWQDLVHLRVVSGASTIAMQVARMQHPEPRTLPRKIAEAIVALRLVHRFGHLAVLRHYLTIAPYGSRARGIVYAARRYFDKPVGDLSWAEAAFLAGLPKIPGRLDVHRPRGRARARSRARYVLGRLRALGWISPGDYAEATTALPRLLLAPKIRRPPSALHAILAMSRVLERRGAGAGHVVPTTLDLGVQRTVAKIVAGQVTPLRNLGAENLAVVVADVHTGAIRAYLGSAGYLDRWHHGAIDYARISRSSGSTLKPFIYALGMSREGFTAATVLDDVGLAPDPATGSYAVRDYDGTFLGPVLYRNALANSRNIPAVEVLRAVGVDPAYRTLDDLGLVRTWVDPSRYGLGMAIGTMPVRLVDLVAAYGTLANGGRRMRLSFFPGGRLGRRVLPEDVSRAIVGFLSDPMARLPSFHRGDALDLPFPVAAKTGTSQGFRDAWCVGFSKRWLVGVWVGRADDGPMEHLSGASGAGRVFHAVMAALEPGAMEGLDDTGFPPPTGWVARRVDMLTGKLAGPLSPDVAVAYFKPGTEPVVVSDAYRELVVDARTGRPAAPSCPRKWRRRRTFVDLGPRFAPWAKAAGLALPPLPRLPGDPRDAAPPRIVVDAPARGARVLADPDLPAADATLRLSARVTPPVPQVVWWVDGRPYKVVDYPYETRWKLAPGRHVFQVRLPYAPVRSAKVAVRVDG